MTLEGGTNPLWASEAVDGVDDDEEEEEDEELEGGAKPNAGEVAGLNAKDGAVGAAVGAEEDDVAAGGLKAKAAPGWKPKEVIVPVALDEEDEGDATAVGGMNLGIEGGVVADAGVLLDEASLASPARAGFGASHAAHCVA